MACDSGIRFWWENRMQHKFSLKLNFRNLVHPMVGHHIMEASMQTKWWTKSTMQLKNCFMANGKTTKETVRFGFQDSLSRIEFGGEIRAAVSNKYNCSTDEEGFKYKCSTWSGSLLLSMIVEAFFLVAYVETFDSKVTQSNLFRRCHHEPFLFVPV